MEEATDESTEAIPASLDELEGQMAALEARWISEPDRHGPFRS